MIIKSPFWHILQKEIALRKAAVLIVAVQKDKVVLQKC